GIRYSSVTGVQTCALPISRYLLLFLFALSLNAATTTENTLERDFISTVHPFLETYCFNCHGKEKQKAKLDLSVYPTVQSVAEDRSEERRVGKDGRFGWWLD